MRIFNTLTGEKELLEKPKGRALKLFVCGITPYDFPHIGNARTFMVFDIFVRFLRAHKYQITYLQNITDIDDKIIAKANEENTDWEEVSAKFERAFLLNMRALDITSVNMYAKATNYIPQIVAQVKTLAHKNHAYLIAGDPSHQGEAEAGGYYFDLSTFPNYGKLSHRTTEQATDGVSRIDMSDKKRNKGDFALWKLSKPGEPGWHTELGYGRPGWHIEDTAITEHFFGPQYDIHGGALDLKFPHHEAEIAQQESASGKSPFVKTWMHSGFLTVGGEKMSKSLNNFVTINEFLKNNRPDVFRMMVFMHHYRSPMDYNDELISTAKKNLSNIGMFLAKLQMANGKNDSDLAFKFMDTWKEAMGDDLNTPRALAAVFEAMNQAEPLFNLTPRAAKLLKRAIKQAFGSIGLDIPSPRIPIKIRLLARKRERARSSKQFIQSDALRAQISALGFILEDTPRGPFLWPRD